MYESFTKAAVLIDRERKKKKVINVCECLHEHVPQSESEGEGPKVLNSCVPVLV